MAQGRGGGRVGGRVSKGRGRPASRGQAGERQGEKGGGSTAACTQVQVHLLCALCRWPPGRNLLSVTASEEED